MTSETKEDAPVVTTAVLPPRQQPKETKEGRTTVELQPIGDLPSLRKVLEICYSGTIKMSISGKMLLRNLYTDGFKSLVLRRVTLESYMVTGLPFPTTVSMSIDDAKDKMLKVLRHPDYEAVVCNWSTQIDGHCYLSMQPRAIILFDDIAPMSSEDKLSLDVKVHSGKNSDEYCNKKDPMGRPVRDDIDFERETVLMNFRLLVDFVAEKT
jgi:hypothetical protein